MLKLIEIGLSQKVLVMVSKTMGTLVLLEDS